jgi:hypothetical protein
MYTDGILQLFLLHYPDVDTAWLHMRTHRKTGPGLEPERNVTGAFGLRRSLAETPSRTGHRVSILATTDGGATWSEEHIDADSGVLNSEDQSFQTDSPASLSIGGKCFGRGRIRNMTYLQATRKERRSAQIKGL